MESKLIGYIRKSKNGSALTLSLDYETLENAERYTTKDGREYVRLIANLAKLQEIIDGEREVTSICQLVEE
jgi:hypothetical protein